MLEKTSGTNTQLGEEQRPGTSRTGIEKAFIFVFDDVPVETIQEEDIKKYGKEDMPSLRQRTLNDEDISGDYNSSMPELKP